MKVLLIWPNSRNEVLGWGDLGAVAEPLALEYLAAGLQPEGHECRILDLRLHPNDLDSALREFQPDLVGVTAFSMHVRRAIEICRRAKELLPECHTITGGHHATFLPEDFFEDDVDFVVSGEGVFPMRDVARALVGGRPVEGIPGVWSRVNDSFVSGGKHELPKLEDLPFPDRKLTADDRASYFIDWMRPVALLRTTVGCPYRCTFCSIWQVMDGRYLLRELQPVVDELRRVEEEWVFLVDDEAFINGRRMLLLAQAIREAGIRKRFFTYCRIDTLLRQREAVAAWRDIGLERLFIGVDAISKKNLDEYNKRCTVAEIEEGLALAEELGIEVFAQFVVNTDYTPREFQQLIRFIEHHRIAYPSFTVLTPLPGTDLLRTFDSVVERQPNGRPNWDLFDCQNAVTATAMPPAAFRKQYRDLYRVFKGAYSQYREHNYLVDDHGRPLDRPADGGPLRCLEVPGLAVGRD